MKLDSVLSSVVLPEPVPPEMIMFRRALIAPSSSITISGVKALKFSRSSSLSGLLPKRRIETAAPSRASGGMIAFTREPSVQAGIDHRADFIDAAADFRHDAVDDLQQVGVVAELDAGLFQLAAALDIDVLRPVDQDIADRMVLEQHLERPQAERFVEHFLDQPLALAAVEERLFGVAQVLDDQADFAAEHVALQLADAVQVELIDQLVVDLALELVELFGLGGVGRAGGRGKGFHRSIPRARGGLVRTAPRHPPKT